jgi:hypothetical protein
MTAATWQDTPAERARLAELDEILLSRPASPAEHAEYQALCQAHEAWMVVQPFYAEWFARLSPHAQDRLSDLGLGPRRGRRP